MQLWYDDGYRSLRCCGCKKMSRSTHWKCFHGIQWHQCIVHRDDPEEHFTTRKNAGVLSQPALKQLSADRAEPISKKQRVQRANNQPANRKRIIQSLNPSQFHIDWTKCPRLAIKFPHLQPGASVSETTAPVQDSEGLVPDTASVQSVTTGASTLSPPVALAVQKTVRKFRYPVRGAATSSGDRQSFLPTDGVFVRKAGESESSHYREDDQRSEL